MSWLSDLAGKAESILNQIDQNAANVLKTENEQLLEQAQQRPIDGEISHIGSETQNKIKNGSMKLSRSLKKLPTKHIDDMKDVQNSDTQNEQSNTVVASENLEIQSGASSSSRRSSWSSRTGGTTVIEFPASQACISIDAVDMNASLHSTHSTHSIEADHSELSASKIVVAQMKLERDQMKAQLDDITRQAAADNSKEIIANYERHLQELATERDQLNEQLFQLEKTNNLYVKSISELETTVSKLHQSEGDVNEKLRMLTSEREHAVAELQQYRSRAQHTLQLKDQIIEELKAAGKVSRDLSSDKSQLDEGAKSDTHNGSAIELQSMQFERDQLREEVLSLRNELDGRKVQCNSLEERLARIEHESKEHTRSLNSALQHEKLQNIQLEEALQVRDKGLEALREETSRQQANYSRQIHEKDSELTKLRSKVTQLNYAGPSSKGFDDRINSLTQSLVQKQNALESVTVERNAIKIQMEKLEQQYRNVVSTNREYNPTRTINVNHTDDDKSQLPRSFMLENPFDTRMLRRVKRAYSTLDAAGIRLGVFIRRPLIRVFFIIYVAILHLWVMVVLFSSTPT